MKKISLKLNKHSFISFFEDLLLTLMLMGGGYLGISLFAEHSFGWAIGWSLASLLLGWVIIHFHDEDPFKGNND
jgi:biotin transporter BioY